MIPFRSFGRTRSAVVAIALIVPFGAAGAQAPAAAGAAVPHQISSIGVGATSLSSTGSSSVGISGYYIHAINHFAMDVQVSAFSESGVSSYGAQVVGGYAWGPFLNPEAAQENWRSAMFFVGGGMWGSFSDAASSSDPMLMFGGNAPIGPVMVKLGYGFILAKGSNISVMNLGVGLKFGQK